MQSRAYYRDMSAEFKDEVTTKIISFLREIGLSVSVGRVDEASFLPGIAIVDGGLVVDEPNLLYPGDLLHEAGHLALAPAELRGTLSGIVEIPGAIAEIVEVAAMCWSYAAWYGSASLMLSNEFHEKVAAKSF